jgi:hypothetical protein
VCAEFIWPKIGTSEHDSLSSSEEQCPFLSIESEAGGPQNPFGRVVDKKACSLLNSNTWRRFELGIISGCTAISFHKEDAAN